MPVRPVPLLCDPISHLEKLALRLVLTFFAVIDIHHFDKRETIHFKRRRTILVVTFVIVINTKLCLKAGKRPGVDTINLGHPVTSGFLVQQSKCEPMSNIEDIPDH